MSIVICVVDKDKCFYMASDLRARGRGIVRDDYQKVFELKPGVYFGMTGIAEAGLKILEQLRSFGNVSVAELIGKAGEIIETNSTKLTITLAGMDEENRFFIWQKNNAGSTTMVKGNDSTTVYSIGSNEQIGEFENYFCRAVASGSSIEEAISTTIRFASSIDSTISSTFKMIKFDRP